MIYKLFQGSRGIKLKRHFAVFLQKLLYISCLPPPHTHKKGENYKSSKIAPKKQYEGFQKQSKTKPK